MNLAGNAVERQDEAECSAQSLRNMVDVVISEACNGWGCIFSGWYSMIEAHGGICFRAPCPTGMAVRSGLTLGVRPYFI